MHTGIVQLGAVIPIPMLTAAQLPSALEAFIAADSDFNAARSARQAASDTYQAATGAVYDWLLAVSNMLATRFGTRWSTAWAQAGFINNSTGIPTKIEDRLGLALALVNFFTANPSYEGALNESDSGAGHGAAHGGADGADADASQKPGGQAGKG